LVILCYYAIINLNIGVCVSVYSFKLTVFLLLFLGSYFLMKMRTGGLNYGADSAEGYGADDSAGFRHGAGNAGGFRYAYRTNFSNSFHKIFSEVHCTSLYPLSSCSMFLSLVSN
jgi:hypothetical protein